MLKMTSQIDSIINAYTVLSKVPSIIGARISKGNKVTSKWSVRNLDKGKSTKYVYQYLMDKQLKVIDQSDFGCDISNELLSSVSPTEKLKAVIKEEKDSKNSKHQYLEIWRSNKLMQCVDLTALDVHGDVYADSEFGSLDWSQDESSIVYIAEKKIKKSEPYIKRKALDDKSKLEGSGENASKKGEEFIYRQDWGEQLIGKYLSVIVVFQLAKETVTVLEGLPDSWAPGQVRFALDGKSVYGVAWETEPRRLGLIFCTNRPSYIFRLTLDAKMEKLTEKGMAVRSVRLSPDGSVAWLERAAGGLHHACHTLQVRDKNKTKTIIEIVENEKQIADGSIFYGVYSQALPSRCYSQDGKRIVFSTPQGNEVRSYVVDIGAYLPRLLDISNKKFSGSTSVLDVHDDVILAVCTNMTTPGQLHIARLPKSGDEASIEWFPVSQSTEVPQCVQDSSIEYLDLEHKDSKDSIKKFSALYMSPKINGSSKIPLVVWPHGGPHSGFVNAYSLEAALFNMLGFASLQINFRGSTGVGDASVRFLPGRAGDADVKDCKLAAEEAVKRFPIDDKMLYLFGGSHGGFLVTHLSGQYPDAFRAVVSRNPVIDASSLFNTSDIADWSSVETGIPFIESGPATEESLLAMRRCSPMVHAHRVKAPTCLMLGSGDKRVPHYQGLEYSRRLKANGVEVRVYMYDDNHSLSSTPAEMDNLINSADWFLKHM